MLNKISKHLPTILKTSAIALGASLFSCLKANAEVGIASVYDDWYHGRQTANGDYYSIYKDTAAACGIRYGTYLTVTNIHNGKSVVVKINDTGGFCRSTNRVLDLSRSAFEKLGGVYPGLLDVETSSH
jgi:rare lipoprotein A